MENCYKLLSRNNNNTSKNKTKSKNIKKSENNNGNNNNNNKDTMSSNSGAFSVASCHLRFASLDHDARHVNSGSLIFNCP